MVRRQAIGLCSVVFFVGLILLLGSNYYLDVSKSQHSAIKSSVSEPLRKTFQIIKPEAKNAETNTLSGRIQEAKNFSNMHANSTENSQYPVTLKPTTVVSDQQRKEAEEFIKLHANPIKKSNSPVTLKPFPGEKPNPKDLVHDTTKSVDREAVKKEWMDEKARRLALGDDDVLLVPEVQNALLNKGEFSVPNIVHFIWFSCHEFKMHHYITMLSAAKIQQPDLILFHTNCEPSGPNWDSLKKFAGNVLKIVKRSPTTTVWGKKANVIEHQADIARLHVMLEVGGIYMDNDVVVIKSLDKFRNNEMVLGEEGYNAVANSIIIANKDSWFLSRWYQEYKNFNDAKWGESSVLVPWCMWQLFPDTIHVVKEKMLRPSWDEWRLIYYELWDWRDSYTMHLYARFMPKIDGRTERTFKELAILNTTYGEVARHVIWDDDKPRDITGWL